MKIKAEKSKLIITAEIDLADHNNMTKEIISLKWIWQVLTRIGRGLEL